MLSAADMSQVDFWFQAAFQGLMSFKRHPDQGPLGVASASLRLPAQQLTKSRDPQRVNSTIRAGGSKCQQQQAVLGSDGISLLTRSTLGRLLRCAQSVPGHA